MQISAYLKPQVVPILKSCRSKQCHLLQQNKYYNVCPFFGLPFRRLLDVWDRVRIPLEADHGVETEEDKGKRGRNDDNNRGADSQLQRVQRPVGIVKSPIRRLRQDGFRSSRCWSPFQVWFDEPKSIVVAGDASVDDGADECENKKKATRVGASFGLVSLRPQCRGHLRGHTRMTNQWWGLCCIWQF